MDPMHVGKCIAALRRENGMTQEALGQKLGVTNKTISRWENGNYMPDIQMLTMLSGEFHVGVDELLHGQRRADGKTPIPIAESAAASIFSMEEQMAFWKKKWLRAHVGFLCVIGIVLSSAIAAACFTFGIWVMGCVPLAVMIVYAVLRNRMMVYAEGHVYDKT